MTGLIIVVGIILVAALVTYFLTKSGKIKDADGNGIPDVIEEKVEEVKEVVKETKARAKRVKEEVADVVTAAKEVVKQVKDVTDAAKGKAPIRKGRKPSTKK
jgi:methyl-accepting chemotaxis protein